MGRKIMSRRKGETRIGSCYSQLRPTSKVIGSLGESLYEPVGKYAKRTFKDAVENQDIWVSHKYSGTNIRI